MKIIPPYLRIYQQILKDLENAFPFLNVPKAKAGRKPKLTDTHIAAIFILSYITNTKVLTLAQLLIDPSIQSSHIFRRYRLKRVYRILREYKLHKLRLMILARLLYGKKIELVIDGTIEGEEYYLLNAYPEGLHKGEPGTLIARRDKELKRWQSKRILILRPPCI